MKFFRIVMYIVMIIILVFTILLNWGQGYLAEQGIIYSDRLVLIKVVLTWLIVPFMLVIGYGVFMSRKLEDSKAVASVFVSNGILIFIISIAFATRLFYFAIFEDNSMHNAYEYGTLTHYEQINPFLYRDMTRTAE